MSNNKQFVFTACTGPTNRRGRARIQPVTESTVFGRGSGRGRGQPSSIGFEAQNSSSSPSGFGRGRGRGSPVSQIVPSRGEGVGILTNRFQIVSSSTLESNNQPRIARKKNVNVVPKG